MRLKNLNITTQFRLGIGCILAFVIILGVVAWRQSSVLWLQTKTLYEHPLQVRMAIGSLETDVMGIRLEFRNVLLGLTEQSRQESRQQLDLHQADAERQFDVLFHAYLGPRSDVEEAHAAFLRWVTIWRDAIAPGRTVNVANNVERVQRTGDIGIARDQMLAAINKIDNFARGKSESIYHEADKLHSSLDQLLGSVIIAILVLSSLLAMFLVRAIRVPLQELNDMTYLFRKGEYGARCGYEDANEFGTLARAFNGMADTIQEEINFREREAELNRAMLQELRSRSFSRQVLEALIRLTGSQLGAVYLLNRQQNTYELLESIGLDSSVRHSFSTSDYEGEFGAVLTTRQVSRVVDIPTDTRFNYVAVSGALAPREILSVPLLNGEEVMAIVSLASIHGYGKEATRLVTATQGALAVWMSSMLANLRIEALSRDLDQQNQQLKTQQEELRVANEELEEQTQRLLLSQDELKVQQEELQVTNEELEEKNELLERQTKQVELARQELEEKADALARASKYKSEFLANMSHELRTPLNSLLLLSQGLAGNREGNLTDEQVEVMRIIHGSGSDLLNLINDILDLSKIEAGRIDVQYDTVQVRDLASGVRDAFQHQADNKQIALEVVVAEDLPAEISTDRKRLDQITRNLIANAIKFTPAGGVTVTFARPAADTRFQREELRADACLAITVRDTGIGIPPELHHLIFEAFQQADGTTSRKYGGTGLGLSISRELSILLGGEIHLESEAGKGATFTLFIPFCPQPRPRAQETVATPVEHEPLPLPNRRPVHLDPPHIADDRDVIAPTDRVMLVIEDDPKFAAILYGKCHEKGFKCLAAATGETGLEMAKSHLPAAIILDLRLPGMDGWEVLAALKGNTRTRHIPVHIMSVEDPTTKARKRGAVGHYAKPVDQEHLEDVFRQLDQLSSGRPKRMLVIDDDAAIRAATVKLVGNGDVTTDEAATGEQAIALLKGNEYDCVVLDLGLPDMDGNELLARLEAEGVELPPVVVYTARDLTEEEEVSIRERAKSIVIKDVRSQERLLDEVSLFLHRVVSRMAEPKRQIIRDLHETDAILRGKKVLVVDDDMRTTFAVARLLSENGMQPLKADNGERALRLLEEHPDISLVLMDVMMPVMDGYETMRRIRAHEGYRHLPIIALTAKAMADDREKCLAAGANDYLPKPVDQARLFSMMRVWLYR